MLELILLLIVVVLFIGLLFFINQFFILKKTISELKFLKSSQSVKYGQLTEQWIPFSKDFPFDSQNFRFIGKPIDGLVFNEDKIVFVEFKTNKSNLNNSQKRVRELVEDKKVEWFELRID